MKEEGEKEEKRAFRFRALYVRSEAIDPWIEEKKGDVSLRAGGGKYLGGKGKKKTAVAARRRGESPGRPSEEKEGGEGEGREGGGYSILLSLPRGTVAARPRRLRKHKRRGGRGRGRGRGLSVYFSPICGKR